MPSCNILPGGLRQKGHSNRILCAGRGNVPIKQERFLRLGQEVIMDTSDREVTTRTSDVRQVLGASFIGTTIEWYDFFIYGTAATLVFGQLFFSPSFSPLAATLSSVATFAVGFVARPLGGIIFGHFGDKLGRKAMLV